MSLSFSGLLPRFSLARGLRRLLLAAVCGLGAAASLAAAEAESPPVQRIAEDVYVIAGAIGEASASNRGRVVNTGFIVARDGVIVIDSGANHNHGEAILAAVARITPKPVKLLINTHAHPQNVLGNSVFAERGIPILASAATVAAMDQRCPRCLESLGQSVGREAMEGTRVHLPETSVPGSQALEIAGRWLRLLHFGHAHTEGDLAVLDETTAVLFSGDLVYRQQLPHLSEASSAGWLAALQQLGELPFKILIPGRGAVGQSADLAPTQGYLSALRQRVSAAYHDGRSADEAIKQAELPEFAGWQGYAERHGRNVQHVYFEIERDDLGGQREDGR